MEGKEDRIPFISYAGVIHAQHLPYPQYPVFLPLKEHAVLKAPEKLNKQNQIDFYNKEKRRKENVHLQPLLFFFASHLDHVSLQKRKSKS